jgi:hypothetical protein
MLRHPKRISRRTWLRGITKLEAVSHQKLLRTVT